MFTHHAELGLQFNLQALQCGSQFGDLGPGCLEGLSADNHFLVQFICLHFFQIEKECESIGVGKHMPAKTELE